MSVRVWCSTDGARRGAIASVELAGAGVTGLLDRAGLRPPGVGDAVLRTLEAVDEGVLTLWSAERASFMVHGSPLVVASAVERLVSLGAVRGDAVPMERFPEARSDASARALAALARSGSALAAGVLLAQARLWDRGDDEEVDRETASMLARLVEPATVVAVGRANVGKSSLLNALARRSVVSVSAEAGTTRDGVGVELDLGGLLVRWFDTPGVRAGESGVDRRARELADRVVAGADLVVVCGDLEHGWVEAPAGAASLRCSTRGDLGVLGGGTVSTAASTGEGIAWLAREVRERLVPASAVERGGRLRWAFDASLGGAVARGRRGG